METGREMLNSDADIAVASASTEILNWGRDHASEIQEDEDKVLSPEVH